MDWTERLAQELGVDPLSGAEADAILSCAREIAHQVERKSTPLAAFVLGASVQARTDAGSDRGVAFADVVATLRGLLPPTGEPS